MPTRAATDRISVYCQRSRASLPLPGKGRNSALLAAADPRGAATLEVEWEKPAALAMPNVVAELTDAAPTFRIRADAGVDALWWQISATDDFAFVPPNFDAVIAPTETLRFDLRTATFFNPGEPYFLRIKARRDGVWGEWSAPLAFQVEKPARPAPVTATVAAGKLRLAWPDAGAGAEYLVFGSNRRDFLPEPFADEEIVAMREQTVELVRPNKNLIAVVAEPHIELEPTARFYRVIARRAGVLSVPGDLIVTPPALAASLPPGRFCKPAGVSWMASTNTSPRSNNCPRRVSRGSFRRGFVRCVRATLDRRPILQDPPEPTDARAARLQASQPEHCCPRR